jgi:calcineurin-like phosphoesterase family protein
VKDMDDGIIESWNSVIFDNEYKVFVLGDFSFHSKEKTKQIMDKLNGRKVLIMGNHDRGRSVTWWREVGFLEVYRYPIVYKENVIMSHEPMKMDKYNKYVYLYGHVHGNKQYQTFYKSSVCVSIERWGYKPVKLNSILFSNQLHVGN